MPIRNIFFVCVIFLGIGSAGFAQQTIALPLDADNCAIHLALSPETSGKCLNRKMGLGRGIVLRIDDVIKNNATLSRPITLTSKQQQPIAPTIQVASAATGAVPQVQASPSRRSRAAAKPGNGYFVHFAFDSAKLEPEFKEHLNRLSDVLKVQAMSTTCLKIIGHTDTVGGKVYNKRLSQKRAKTVATYLKVQRNIPSSRLMIEAAGEDRPLPNIKGDDALNRRVEFVTKESTSGCS
jgi:outer membrane protein OmpA-like peptidoglycan-associated protein